MQKGRKSLFPQYKTFVGNNSCSTLCPEKRDHNVFCNIFYKTPAIPMKVLCVVFWINLLQTDINIFHYTWIMSIHYLVKLEMFIAHVLPSTCYTKKLRSLSHLRCGLKFAWFESSLITTCEKYYKWRCTKHASLMWTYRRRHWRMAATMTKWTSLAHSVLSRCFSSSRSVMNILYTFSSIVPTNCSQLDFNLASSEATVKAG